MVLQNLLFAKKYRGGKEMKEIFVKRILCILVAVIFLLPVNVLVADDPDDGKGRSGDVNTYTWREAESWDQSWDVSSESSWQVIYAPVLSSDGYYTATDANQPSGDYAEWDFTVFTSGEYYFWVRAWIKVATSWSVSLYWNGEEIATENFMYPAGARGEWYWKNFTSFYLSEGDGTLRIEDNTNYLDVIIDNILITNNENYEPWGKEVEGLTSHEIGTPCLDFGYIKEVTEHLSNTTFAAPWPPDEIPKGRAFGTEGEWYAADYIEEEI